MNFRDRSFLVKEMLHLLAVNELHDLIDLTFRVVYHKPVLLDDVGVKPQFLELLVLIADIQDRLLLPGLHDFYGELLVALGVHPTHLLHHSVTTLTDYLEFPIHFVEIALNVGNVILNVDLVIVEDLIVLIVFIAFVLV